MAKCTWTFTLESNISLHREHLQVNKTPTIVNLNVQIKSHSIIVEVLYHSTTEQGFPHNVDIFPTWAKSPQMFIYP